MLRKSNISLSNRALFYPNKKNMLLQHEQLQESTTTGRLLTNFERIGHSNETKKNLPKRETANSSFSNLPKSCFGERRNFRFPVLSFLLVLSFAEQEAEDEQEAEHGEAKVRGNRVSFGCLRGGSNVRYPKTRVLSQTFEDAGQSNNCKDTTVKAPLFAEVHSSWTCLSYAEAKRGLKVKVLPDQTRPDFWRTGRLAHFCTLSAAAERSSARLPLPHLHFRLQSFALQAKVSEALHGRGACAKVQVTERSGNPIWFNTQIKSNKQKKFSLPRPFSKRCLATSLVCFANPRTPFVDALVSRPFGPTDLRSAKANPRASEGQRWGCRAKLCYPRSALVNALVCKANPRASEGERCGWPEANPRHISKQWLEKVGFTFSPFAFIFGTTLLFAALASTLQKQAGKQWLQTLSYTKLPGLTENKISQPSSWVFLESVLSHYINRNKFFLVSTTCFSRDATYSSKLWKPRPQTLGPFLAQPKAEHRQPRLPKKGIQILLSPLWSQHLKKDFLGVFPLCRTNSLNLNFSSSPRPHFRFAKVRRASLCSPLPRRGLQSEALHGRGLGGPTAGTPKGSEAKVSGRSEKGFTTLGLSRSIERSLNRIGGTESRVPLQAQNGRLPERTKNSSSTQERVSEATVTGCSPTDSAGSDSHRKGFSSLENVTARSVLAPQLKRTFTWPWYKITAYCPPNHFVVPTWNDYTTTQANDRLDFIQGKPVITKTNLKIVNGAVEYAPENLRQAESGILTQINFNPTSRSSEAEKSAFIKPIEGRVEKEPTTLRGKANNGLRRRHEPIEGLLTTTIEYPEKKSKINSSPSLFKMLYELELLALHSRAPSWFFGSSSNDQPFFGSVNTSVQRLRLEDDSIPSKKASIYSKKKIHHDTLSARVLNVVKKSFYNYGLSIPRFRELPLHTFGSLALSHTFDRRAKVSESERSKSLAVAERSSATGYPASARAELRSAAPFVEGGGGGVKVGAAHPPTWVAAKTQVSETLAKVEVELPLVDLDERVDKKSNRAKYSQLLRSENPTNSSSANFSEDRVCDFVREITPTKPELAKRTRASLEELSLIFQTIAIPKKSLWEYGHYISGYNFPELQDDEVADLFKSKRHFGEPKKGLKVAASLQSKVGMLFAKQKYAKLSGRGATRVAALFSEVSQTFGLPDKLSQSESDSQKLRRSKTGKATQLVAGNSWFCIAMNQVFLTPYSIKVPPKVLLDVLNKTESIGTLKNAPCELSLCEIAVAEPGSAANPADVVRCRASHTKRSFASNGYHPQEGDAKLELPKQTFGKASTAQVDTATALRSRTRQREQVLVEGFTLRYTPLDLKQENRVKKAFKKLGREYSDYLKQPKDSLPALLLSPSIEEDKQIEQEESQRLAQEKAAAKADAKRTQDEEYTRTSTTIEEELNSLDSLEVAFKEVKNNVSNLEEEPLNDEEIEDSRFERLRFTRELETKKEEEDYRGLALFLTRRGLNPSKGNLEEVCQSDLLVKRARAELSSEPPSGVPGTDQTFDHFRPIGRLERLPLQSFALQRTAPLLALSLRESERSESLAVAELRSLSRSESAQSEALQAAGYPPEGGVRRSIGRMLRPGPFQPSTRTLASLELELSVRSDNFVRRRSNIFGFVLFKPVPPLSISKAEYKQELCFTKRRNVAQFATKKIEPKVSDRKHSFFGQRSFWPTRLFSQEERLLSAHTVNPYIRYDQRNPWLILEQGGILLDPKRDNRNSVPTDNYPRVRASRANSVCKMNQTDNFPTFDSASFSAKLNTSSHSCLEPKDAIKTRDVSSLERSSSLLATLHTKKSKIEDLQNLKNLQTQARLGLIRFLHFPVVEAASVTEKAVPQNRIYKSDPRLRLTTLESSTSADWRNDRKVEASPFRVSSKDRVHIILPKISENQWQKSIEWQLKRHFLDEDTRIKALVATQPFKTLKVKKIERSLPWLTMTGPDRVSSRFRLSNSSFASSSETRGRVVDGSSSEARVRFATSEEPQKASFKLFQWPYKTVGILGSDDNVVGPEKPKQDLWSDSSIDLSNRYSVLAPLGLNWNPLLARSRPACSPLLSTSTPFSPFRLLNYSRIPLASNFTTYSKDSSALSFSQNPLLDITNKLFSNQRELSTELVFEAPAFSSWFLIYRLFLALLLKEIFKYIYRISLKNFFIKILNSDFGRTITSPEFRHSIQFEPFPEFYKPKNRLKDLIGIKNALLPLSEIIWFLRNKCRSRNGPHGVILLGPEGVDTTAIAQAVAGEAKVPIIVQSLRALTLTHSHPQKRLEKVLLLARAQSPCVLFLDELDVIGQSREGVVRKTSGEENSLISLDSSHLLEGSTQLQSLDEHATSQGRRVDLMLRLLTVMDGLHHLNGVVIITTSKNTATLDPALLRPGRFDRLIHLTLPNHDQRVELFKARTRGLTFDSSCSPSCSAKLSTSKKVSTRKSGNLANPTLDEHSSLLSVDELEYLSIQTENMSGADIVSAINYSTLRAIVNDTIHTVETLEYGLNCVKALKYKQNAGTKFR